MIIVLVIYLSLMFGYGEVKFEVCGDFLGV